jgi:hypothetical protein
MVNENPHFRPIMRQHNTVRIEKMPRWYEAHRRRGRLMGGGDFFEQVLRAAVSLNCFPHLFTLISP